MEFDDKDLKIIYDAVRIAKTVSEALEIKQDIDDYKRILKRFKTMRLTYEHAEN